MTEAEQELVKTCQLALKGNTADSLLSASVQLSVLKFLWIERKRITWRCIFDKSATADEIELGRIAGSEIIAAYWNNHRYTEQMLVSSQNDSIEPLELIIYKKH